MSRLPLTPNVWIDRYKTFKEVFDNLTSQSFDINHTLFRSAMMNVIDEQRRKSFLARYSFEGDDKFTKPKQRMFFRMLYDYGQVCIYNPTKKTISTLKKKVSERKWEVLSTSGLDNFVNGDTIKSIINDDRVVMLPNNFYYDENLRPMVGYAITYPGSNSVIKSVKVSVDDAAFALANPDLHPMWYLFMPFNYQYGTIQTIIKKRLQMSDPLIVKNNVNNNEDYLLVERIFDLDNNILPLNPSTASLNSLQQVDSAKIDINKLITPDLKKLSFGYDDKITDLIVALNEIYNHTNRIMGVRDEILVKHNTSIDDGLNKELLIAILDKDFRDQMDMFIDEYQKIYGIKLTLIDHLNEVKQEQIDEEKQIAGRPDMKYFKKDNEKENNKEVNNEVENE